MPTVEELREKQTELASAYHDTFRSESGQKVLKDLKAQFYDSDLLNRSSEHNTMYNLGLRDAVRYILEKLEGDE